MEAGRSQHCLLFEASFTTLEIQYQLAQQHAVLGLTLHFQYVRNQKKSPLISLSFYVISTTLVNLLQGLQLYKNFLFHFLLH